MRIAAVLGLGLFIFFGAAMIRSSAPTYDEPVHLASGFTALRNGSRLLNGNDHPPLAEMWAALPLLILKPAVFFQSQEWLSGRPYHYADFFLYHNRVDAERLLNTARLWCLVSWGALLALGIWGWARKLGGGVAAAIGGALLGLCPPLFSNAALVTTDMGSSLFFFLTFFVLQEESRSIGRWLSAGICMGAAMACKFNMFVLPLFVLAMLLAESNLRRISGNRERFPVGGFVLMLAASALVLLACYRFVNVHLYWRGLTATLARLGEGRPTFFYGSYSRTGSWFYFPAAFALKTPIPVMLLAGAGVWALWRRVRESRLGDFRNFVWLVVPPSVYFFMACFSKTQIGYRHILPV
jgi:hypothetical protein